MLTGRMLVLKWELEDLAEVDISHVQLIIPTIMPNRQFSVLHRIPVVILYILRCIRYYMLMMLNMKDDDRFPPGQFEGLSSTWTVRNQAPVQLLSRSSRPVQTCPCEGRVGTHPPAAGLKMNLPNWLLFLASLHRIPKTDPFQRGRDPEVTK